MPADAEDCLLCERATPSDELDGEGICLDCHEAAADQAMMESSYRASVL